MKNDHSVTPMDLEFPYIGQEDESDSRNPVSTLWQNEVLCERIARFINSHVDLGSLQTGASESLPVEPILNEISRDEAILDAIHLALGLAQSPSPVRYVQESDFAYVEPPLPENSPKAAPEYEPTEPEIELVDAGSGSNDPSQGSGESANKDPDPGRKAPESRKEKESLLLELAECSVQEEAKIRLNTVVEKAKEVASGSGFDLDSFLANVHSKN
eukprot:TRINITY_DN2388_c0_g2_i1.p1 TRINITY_DN2388_c0_g2~~TRINITY_DN2388_c0_g2_i1.p1  ORF type:complete len:229 (-),score=51.03 TRINITY_DN2388_c0_g2_i1:37-681(-)